jgi:hypothetical protein
MDQAPLHGVVVVFPGKIDEAWKFYLTDIRPGLIKNEVGWVKKP